MLNMLCDEKKPFAADPAARNRMSQDWTFVGIFLREGKEGGELHWRLLEI